MCRKLSKFEYEIFSHFIYACLKVDGLEPEGERVKALEQVVIGKRALEVEVSWQARVSDGII